MDTGVLPRHALGDAVADVIYEAANKRADKLRAKGGEVDFNELLRMEPDMGDTNVLQLALGPENRRLVPMTSFSEPDQVGGSLQPIWFALNEARPVSFFGPGL